MTEDRQAVLVQFAKWPRPGRVKTRLIPLLGEQGAMEAHIRLSLQVMRQLAQAGQRLWLYWDEPCAEPPNEATSLLAQAGQLGVEQGVQQGSDLGERMTRALAEGLARAPAAMIVGSDCPSVDATYVQQALAALNHADVVLGPSEDGGYVLIAARKAVPGMLGGVAWGTGQTLVQTEQALSRHGLTSQRLSTRWDVDEPEDWLRFIAS